MMMDRVRYCDVQIGDVVASASGKALFVADVPRWYALRVRPQREGAAEAWLRLRGVYGFHPVQPHRFSRGGKTYVRYERFVPGYVFARFGGEPNPAAVLAGPYITDAVRLAGRNAQGVREWGILAPEDLRMIHAMRRVNADAEAARKAIAERTKQAKALRVGDPVLFRSGPFSEVDCEIVELPSSGRATVKFRIFGRDSLVEAPVADLVKKPA